MRNRILNVVCIVLAGSGLWWTATYFGVISIMR